jgi:hypothetical protein
LTEFVLQRDLTPGPAGDRPVLIEMDVLPHNLGDPDTADHLTSGPDRLGGGSH